MEAIRAERREKGCNSETSAQIALKIKFGKEKVVSKRKGKWNLYHPSKRAKRFERSEGSVVTQKLVLRSSSDLYALSMMEPKATSWLVYTKITGFLFKPTLRDLGASYSHDHRERFSSSSADPSFLYKKKLIRFLILRELQFLKWPESTQTPPPSLC